MASDEVTRLREEVVQLRADVQWLRDLADRLTERAQPTPAVGQAPDETPPGPRRPQRVDRPGVPTRGGQVPARRTRPINPDDPIVDGDKWPR